MLRKVFKLPIVFYSIFCFYYVLYSFFCTTFSRFYVSVDLVTMVTLTQTLLLQTISWFQVFSVTGFSFVFEQNICTISSIFYNSNGCEIVTVLGKQSNVNNYFSTRSLHIAKTHRYCLNILICVFWLLSLW